MNRYRQARIKAGLSQKEAAIALGVSSPSMSDWENGKTRPTHDHLVKMAKLYGTTTDYLSGIDYDLMDCEPIEENALKEKVISNIDNLSYNELVKLSCFLKGMKAGRELMDDIHE